MAVTRLNLKPNPTNKDLQAAIHETHDCLNQLAGELRETRHASANRQTVISDRMSKLETAMGIKYPSPEEAEAGARMPKIGRRLGGLRPWHAASIAVPVIAGGITAYKVIEPAVVAFAAALHHALMTAH